MPSKEAIISYSETLMLVTGGTGYLGEYCISRLLSKDIGLRTTVRSQKK